MKINLKAKLILYSGKFYRLCIDSFLDCLVIMDHISSQKLRLLLLTLDEVGHPVTVDALENLSQLAADGVVFVILLAHDAEIGEVAAI